MRYLKTFESFGENKQEGAAELAAEILAMAGENVTPQEVEKSVEDAIESGEAQSQGQEEVQIQNESVGEFLNWWWELLTQQQYNPGQAAYDISFTAFGAWLATIASTGLGLIGIHKVGKSIKGLFKGKEIDFTEWAANWAENEGIDLSKVDLNTEEGKQIMARMYKDFEKDGGKL